MRFGLSAESAHSQQLAASADRVFVSSLLLIRVMVARAVSGGPPGAEETECGEPSSWRMRVTLRRKRVFHANLAVHVQTVARPENLHAALSRSLHFVRSHPAPTEVSCLRPESPLRGLKRLTRVIIAFLLSLSLLHLDRTDYHSTECRPPRSLRPPRLPPTFSRSRRARASPSTLSSRFV